MQRLREDIRKKRPELWADNSWFYHQNNASSHNFARNSTNILPQPPYSPDLVTCDFWLFPKLKKLLRGHCFDSIDNIKTKIAKLLNSSPPKRV